MVKHLVKREELERQMGRAKQDASENKDAPSGPSKSPENIAEAPSANVAPHSAASAAKKKKRPKQKSVYLSFFMFLFFYFYFYLYFFVYSFYLLVIYFFLFRSYTQHLEAQRQRLEMGL